MEPATGEADAAFVVAAGIEIAEGLLVYWSIRHVNYFYRHLVTEFATS